MLRDILLVQKREWDRRLSEQYVHRDVDSVFDPTDDLVRVVIGPRRAGKSFFALHVIGSPEKCGYVNFDDERLLDVKDYDDILNAIDAVYDHPQTILLDEVQNLPRWELFVNRLQRQGRHLLVTGSNSNLLSTELATHLTGRHLLIPLFPFSFSESLGVLGLPLTDSEHKAHLETYLINGGFPEPLMKKIDRTDYLRTLSQAVIYKDIVKRYRIRAAQGMEDLARYLFSNVAKEYSYRTLTKVTRCQSVNTVEKYVHYLEVSFLFFSLRRFSFKVRQQASYNKKIYCVDNGLAMAMGSRFSPDEGRLFENLAAIALWQETLRNNTELFYWKNAQNEEVDFVRKEGLQIVELIQVCRTLDDPKTRDREVRALLKAGDELKCQNLLVLTTDQDEVQTVEWFGLKGVVRFLPLWKWLLAVKK
jgi:predicted AAA+ superfamily ATPase